MNPALSDEMDCHLMKAKRKNPLIIWSKTLILKTKTKPNLLCFKICNWSKFYTKSPLTTEQKPWIKAEH